MKIRKIMDIVDNWVVIRDKSISYHISDGLNLKWRKGFVTIGTLKKIVNKPLFLQVERIWLSDFINDNWSNEYKFTEIVNIDGQES